MAQESEKIEKANNDQDHRLLKQQQEQLLQFMQMNDVKQALEKAKNLNGGRPMIMPLWETLPKLAQWRKAGINIVCLLDELEPTGSRQLFSCLQYCSTHSETKNYRTKCCQGATA